MHPLKTSDDSHTVWTENRGQVTDIVEAWPARGASQRYSWNRFYPIASEPTGDAISFTWLCSVLKLARVPLYRGLKEHSRMVNLIPAQIVHALQMPF